MTPFTLQEGTTHTLPGKHDKVFTRLSPPNTVGPLEPQVPHCGINQSWIKSIQEKKKKIPEKFQKVEHGISIVLTTIYLVLLLLSSQVLSSNL